ncbi:MAG: hypothetical protein AB4911_24040 [Oscillochloridaceae bacterium umkhey_bin13]
MDIILTRLRYANWFWVALALAPAIPLAVWLNQAVVPGVGWVWLWITVGLGGVAVELVRRAHGVTPSCARGPQLRPLQVSCLALQALGVVLYQSSQQAAFGAAFPTLSASWLPFACVVAGMLGLGLISTSTDCRDAELQGRV